MAAMKYIGAHVSTQGGVEFAPLNAAEIAARAFALFTKNQRQWRSKPLSPDSIERFKENCLIYDFSPDVILPHDGYLINLGSPDPAMHDKSRQAFLDEMIRCEQLGLKLLNFHPGAHKNEMSEEDCLDRIAEAVNWALARSERVVAVIENTAGMGSSVGYRFEHLARIIGAVSDKTRIGVCLDTCHTFAAGYDIRTAEVYRNTIETFNKLVGLSYLRSWHLNDSKGGLGSRLDRHQSLGEGELGWQPFKFIVNDPRMDGIPMVLETIDSTKWPQEIKTLYELIGSEMTDNGSSPKS